MSTGDGALPLVPLPVSGRRFTTTREVRLADASLHGRLRLDAIARYLQDVANDDARDALGPEEAAPWVVRRTTIDIGRWPRFQEPLEITTFCGGVGGRWAERRTSIQGAAGGRVEASSLWVHIEMTTGRPAPLPANFFEVFASEHSTRRVTGRLTHPAPPPDAPRRPWPLRRTDYDVMGHVNNSAYWAAAEEVLAAPAPARYELEHRQAVEPGQEVDLAVGEGAAWLVGEVGVHASMRVGAAPRPPG